MSKAEKLKKGLETPSNRVLQSVISNDLARQNSTITLEEEKLLHCIFSQLNPHGKNATKVEINKKELFEILDLKSNNRYSETKKKFKSLINKSVVDIVDKDGSDLMGAVITTVKSSHKSDFFEINLNADFMPFIENLMSHYTKLSIDSVVHFDSKYSLDLYKYLKSWSSHNWENARYLSTKDLKELFGISKDGYVYNSKFNRALFEKKTLDVAIMEINTKTELIVKYDKAKRGNRVVAYVFDIIDWDKYKKQAVKHDKQMSIDDI